MSWIRLNSDLPGSPRILQLARALRKDEVYALGAAATWFCWLDKNSVDGTTGLTPRELDSMALHCKGLANALLAIGWAKLDEAGYVYAVDFSQYNGETAKERAQAARRQNEFKRRKGNADSVTEVTDEALPKALPREDNSIIHSSRGDVMDEGGRARAARDSRPAPTNRDKVPLTTAERAVLVSDEFRMWMRSLAEAVPGLSRLQSIPRDAAPAAVAAFGCCPDAGGLETQPKLRRYYEATESEVKRTGVRVYRPDGARSIFDGLHDIVTYACKFCEVQDAMREREAKKPRGMSADQAKEAYLEEIRARHERQGVPEEQTGDAQEGGEHAP